MTLIDEPEVLGRSMLNHFVNTSGPMMLDILASRRTASQFEGPSPTDEQIGLLIAAADSAPDHGKLRPWRISVVAGEARERLGDSFARGARRRRPDLTETELQREKSKALRAPLVLIVSAKISQSSKIPAIEQVMAAAAAVQNVLIAAHAMALGAAWKTGTPAYDSALKNQLGLQETDHIVAFIYIGRTINANVTATRPTDGIVSYF
jgi:nitroreductase